jgi:hypothetical protein
MKIESSWIQMNHVEVYVYTLQFVVYDNLTIHKLAYSMWSNKVVAFQISR